MEGEEGYGEHNPTVLVNITCLSKWSTYFKILSKKENLNLKKQLKHFWLKKVYNCGPLYILDIINKFKVE